MANRWVRSLVALVGFASLVLPATPTYAADNWEQVGAVNLGADAVAGGKLTTYNGQLVVGAYRGLNQTNPGTQIYVLNDNNWLKKKDGGLGVSGGNATSVVSDLEEHNGQLYAHVIASCEIVSGNPQGDSCKFVWRSTDLTNWTQAAPQNFGPGTGAKLAFNDTLTHLNNELHVGVSGDLVSGSQKLYAYKQQSDTQWPRVDNGGSGGFGQAGEGVAGSTFRFGTALFMGAHKSPLAPGTQFANIYRSFDGVSWTPTNGLGSGYWQAGGEFTFFNNELYTTITRYTLPEENYYSAVYKAVDPLGGNPRWQRVSPEFQGVHGETHHLVTDLVVYNDQLFFGVHNREGLSQIWSSSDTITWNKSAPDGFGQNYQGIGDLHVHNGSLYASAIHYQGSVNTMSIWRVLGSGEASMTISLAPRLLMTPDRFAFGNDTYTFIGPAENLTVRHDAGNGSQQVSVERVDQDGGIGGDERGTYYRIKVSNIPKKRFARNSLDETRNLYSELMPMVGEALAYAPPPATNVAIFRRAYPFRITFREPVSANSLESLVAYVSERGAKDNIFFGDGSCQAGSARAYLCLKEIVTVENPNTSTIRLPLLQKIELSGVYVAGNVGAPVQIRNIKLHPNAIAVGGQFVDVTGTLLVNYLQDNPNSLLKWSNIESQINELFEKRARGTTAVVNEQGRNTWYLNTPGDDPLSSGTPTTFSQPPEGKLWNVNGNLTLNSVSRFIGSGTIAVNGDLVINGPIECVGAKRLGFIVRGDITFKDTHIDCGAYVALGRGNSSRSGTINFDDEPPAQGDTANGIFVARNDIIIPQAASSPYVINYDQTFAQNPTVLFRELLTLIVSASS